MARTPFCQASRLTVSASALSLGRLFALKICRRFFFLGWDGRGWIAKIFATGVVKGAFIGNGRKSILAYHTSVLLA